MIARAAESRLRQTSHHALRRVTCEVNNGVAVLRGAVPSFYLKQVAQIVIGNLEGVARIVNQIDVSPNMEIEDERWR
jgi:osmotically-inducible protein OsmY